MTIWPVGATLLMMGVISYCLFKYAEKLLDEIDAIERMIVILKENELRDLLTRMANENKLG